MTTSELTHDEISQTGRALTARWQATDYAEKFFKHAALLQGYKMENQVHDLKLAPDMLPEGFEYEEGSFGEKWCTKTVANATLTFFF